MEIYEKSVIIRPELAAPEVDDYDEVNISDIVTTDLDIGKYVEYTLSNDAISHADTVKNRFSH